MSKIRKNDSGLLEALKDEKTCKHGSTDSVGNTSDSFPGSTINQQDQLLLGIQPHVLASIAGYFDLLQKWSQLAQVDDIRKVES